MLKGKVVECAERKITLKVSYLLSKWMVALCAGVLSMQVSSSNVSSANGGLYLPGGFEAVAVTENLEGQARQITVDDQGNVIAKLRYTTNGKELAWLHDADKDGVADVVKTFGEAPHGGGFLGGGQQAGVKLYKGYLYFSTELAVYRYRYDSSTKLPDGEPELIVLDEHSHGHHEHNAKPFAFDNEGHLYVPFGAPSNSCQEPKRTPGSLGVDPCPQLEGHAGVWQFDAHTLNQTQKDGKLYATGIRSTVAMEWNDQDDELYIVMHGREQLAQFFPAHYSAWQAVMLPAEEFIRVVEGSNFGWPYCYYDQLQHKKVLAPEYGGNGKITGRCEGLDLPEIGFPGHWAPNGLHFYTGDQFPERYKNGAFIAFHGSTIRAPYPQAGYFVAFVPFENGRPTDKWEVFADGFAQQDTIVNVSDAVYRPMGIATGPDGSLYLGETEKGKLWRIQFKGNRKKFGLTQLAAMKARELLPHIATPDEIESSSAAPLVLDEEGLYVAHCAGCHQLDGQGVSGRYPPLSKSDFVGGDKSALLSVILNGRVENLVINGRAYSNPMPQHDYLEDGEIALLASYLRRSFGNKASDVNAEDVAKVRRSLEKEDEPLYQAYDFSREGEFTNGIEGPATDAKGNIYAVNFREKGTIGVTNSNGESRLFVKLPKGSVGNGIRISGDGHLWVADYQGHNILKVDVNTRAVSVHAHDDRMNQPNDIALTDSGLLFASDPNWAQSTGQLWRIDHKGVSTLLDADLATSNGIEVSPDDDTLYLNESVEGRVWAYKLSIKGEVSGKRLLYQFDDFGLDGMRCDSVGNLYVTRHGKGTVAVLSPQGDLLREVKLKGKKPSNIAFGGPDGRTAYVTMQDRGMIESFRTEHPGRAWQGRQ